MKRVALTIFMIGVLLTACGPKATPTANPADIQSTAVAMAFTMAAQTQAAMPTITPSDTPIPPPPATDTPFPTPTPASLGQPPSKTPASSSSSNASCDQPLTTWSGDEVTLNLTNEAKGTAKLSLYLKKNSFGDCGYIGRQFTNASSVVIPLGCYSASAFVEGKKDIKAFGSFCITSAHGKGNLVIQSNGRIVLKAGCSPDC
jgi:hypothetical protein